MSLDVKYRPKRYSDVLGQDTTVEVLQGVVQEGAGFHQSYLFGGAFGSGKTTLARILARALLCDAPVNGEPCDECHSCKVMLTNPDAHECFVEVDAAANSGKASVAKIIEDVQYNTFSGKQRIVLMDEAHELSRQSLDLLLLPMEDTQKNSQNKKLVCIFCTTEPEKMRPAVLSRCAPSFMIRPCSAEVIAERLTEICEGEGISFESSALPLIAEVKELHIRDALKAVEGVSRLGEVSVVNVRRYLNLDLEESYLSILSNLGVDLAKVSQSLDTLLERVSPLTIYKKVAERAAYAYKASVLGSSQVPSYLNLDLLKEVGERLGGHLLALASVCASRPLRATSPMLLCDLSALHYQISGTMVIPEVVPLAAQVAHHASSAPLAAPSSPPRPELKVQLPAAEEVEVPNTASELVSETPSKPSEPALSQESSGSVGKGKPYVTSDGRHIDPRAVRTAPRKDFTKSSKSVRWFQDRVNERLEEILEDGGLQRQYHLGSS